MQRAPEAVRAAHEVLARYRGRQRGIDAAKHDRKILGEDVGKRVDHFPQLLTTGGTRKP